MKPWNIFVKVSGDTFTNPEFLHWIKLLAAGYDVVICVGGGTQIKEEFIRRGLSPNKFGPFGRKIDTVEERETAKVVLLQNQVQLRQLLEAQGVSAKVIIPVLKIGGVSCHINGDEFLRLAYQGFDELYLITTPDRVEVKLKQFKRFGAKLQVKAF